MFYRSLVARLPMEFVYGCNPCGHNNVGIRAVLSQNSARDPTFVQPTLERGGQVTAESPLGPATGRDGSRLPKPQATRTRWLSPSTDVRAEMRLRAKGKGGSGSPAKPSP